MPIEWLKDLRKKDKQKNFLVSGKALWEEDENKKPFFLQIAIPKVKENWNNLFQVTKKWIEKEENNSEAWYEYGFANEKILNFEEALNSYNKSIVLDKNKLVSYLYQIVYLLL